MNDDDEIDLDNLAATAFPGINAQHRETMAALKAIGQKLDRIEQKEDWIMSKMDDFKRDFTAYVTKVNAWIDAANANQATSDQLVAAAVAAAQAGEDVDVQALSDQLAAAAAKVPTVPAAPPAVPATP